MASASIASNHFFQVIPFSRLFAKSPFFDYSFNSMNYLHYCNHYN